jgi:hypothetical protein
LCVNHLLLQLIAAASNKILYLFPQNYFNPFKPGVRQCTI